MLVHPSHLQIDKFSITLSSPTVTQTICLCYYSITMYTCMVWTTCLDNLNCMVDQTILKLWQVVLHKVNETSDIWYSLRVLASIWQFVWLIDSSYGRMMLWCIPVAYHINSLSFLINIFNWTIQLQQTYQPASNSYHYNCKHNISQVSKKILIPVMKIHKLSILLLQALDNLSTKKNFKLRIWSWLAQGIKLWSEIVNFPKLLILLNMKR
jgi:hypothetical protein